MAAPTEDWVVTVHEQERVLEVHYPPRPSEASFERYSVAVRTAITSLERQGPWDCLVDQTALRALAPEYTSKIAELNSWAHGHGMRRTARVVADSAIGELQSLRILRDGGVKHIGTVYTSREVAWRALTER